MKNRKVIPGLTDIEEKAIAGIETFLEDVCEPRLIYLPNTKLILYVNPKGECYLGDTKTRITNPDCYIGQNRVPAIKLRHTVYIVPRG